MIENIKRECRRNLPCFAKSVENEIKDGDKFCPYCGAENEINKEEPSHDISAGF